MTNMHRILVLALAFAGAPAALAVAQSPAATRAAPPEKPPEYRPSVGDLMTFAVQPRHIKLGIAGRARNWDYLAYEAKELRNAFARIGRTIPTYRKQPLPDLFASAIMPALDKLDGAIKAKDGRAFDAAYKEVTAACNACHTSLDHAFVVIREPAPSPNADQDLSGSGASRPGARR